MKCCSAGGRVIVVPCQVLRDSRVLSPALPLIICVISKISAHLKRGGKYSLPLVRVAAESFSSQQQKMGWKHLCVCETCPSSRLKLSTVRVGWPQSASSFL